MAYINVSEKYNEVIYSGDAKTRVILKINDITVCDLNTLPEDNKISQITKVHNIIKTGENRFSLDNFVAQDLEIKIYNFDYSLYENLELDFNQYNTIELSLATITDKIELSTITEDVWEEVPIGIFNIIGTPTTDKDITTIKAKCNRIKFDMPYNAKPLIDASGGKVQIGALLQDICLKSGVELGTTLPFINSTTEIGVYDSTIPANIYVSYICEKAGCIAVIGRDGKLYLVPINKDLYKHILDSNLIQGEGKLQYGDNFIYDRVYYEFALNKYVKPLEETDNTTIYINSANPYITNQEEIDNIYDSINGFEIQNLKFSTLGNPCIDAWDIVSFNKNGVEYKTLANNILVFNGVLRQNFDTSIGTKESVRENVTIVGEKAFKKNVNAKIDNINATVEIVTEQVQENTSNITTTQQDVSGLNIKVEENEQDIEKKTTELGIRIDGINLNFVNSGNNILIGTQFYDMQGWGIGLNRNYVEQPTPPDNPIDLMYWYCSQDYGEYKNGTIYRYDTDKWVAYPNLTRKDLDNQITYIKNFDVLDNEETRKTALSERYGRLYTTGKQGEEGLIGDGVNYLLDNAGAIFHNIERLNIEQEYMTFSFKIKNEIEYGEGIIGNLLFNKEPTVSTDLISSMVGGGDSLFYKSSRSGLYTIKIPILNEGNVIYGVSGDTPPEDTTKKWLYTEDYFMGILLTYENGNWIQDTSKYIFNDGTYDYILYDNTFYINMPIDSRESTHTTVMAGLQNQYVTDVGEDEPDYIDYSTMWANPVTDEIKIPIFENEEFKSWETIDVTYTQAVDNYELAPEIFEGPCVLPKGNLIFYDMKLEYGDYTKWTPSQDEFYGRNFAITDKGFYIKRADNIMFIDEDEIKATYKNIPIFSLDGQEVFGKIIKTEKTDITGLITKKIKVGTKDIYIRYKED